MKSKAATGSAKTVAASKASPAEGDAVASATDAEAKKAAKTAENKMLQKMYREAGRAAWDGMSPQEQAPFKVMEAVYKAERDAEIALHKKSRKRGGKRPAAKKAEPAAKKVEGLNVEKEGAPDPSDESAVESQGSDKADIVAATEDDIKEAPAVDIESAAPGVSALQKCVVSPEA